jgi:hypothetical protein
VAVRAIVADVKKDKRWRYSPSEEDEQWLTARADATDRTEGDIIYELVQKGKRAFDKQHGTERKPNRGS